MEQVNNSGVQAMLRLLAAQQTIPASSGAEKNTGGGFQKQLERASSSAESAGAKPTGQSEPSSQTKTDGETGGVKTEEDAQAQTGKEEETLTEERVALAAMSVMQAPVTVVEQPQAQDVTEEIAAPVAAVDVEAPALVEARAETAPETAQAEAPAAEVLTPERSEQPQVQQTHAQAQVPEDTGADTLQAQTPAEQPHQAQTGSHTETGAQPQAEARTRLEPLTRQVQTGDGEDGKGKVTGSGVEAQPVFQNVEDVPIKVGDAQAPVQTQQPQDVGQQMAAGLTQAVEQGESRVTVQLEPESLGTVTVELTQSANGALHVVLTAQNSQTRGLLESHAANLQGMLAERSGQSVQVEVQRQEQAQQHQRPYDGENGAHSQQQERQQAEEQQRQRQERQQSSAVNSVDFMHQLRLGLIPMDGEAV